MKTFDPFFLHLLRYQHRRHPRPQWHVVAVRRLFHSIPPKPERMVKDMKARATAVRLDTAGTMFVRTFRN